MSRAKYCFSRPISTLFRQWLLLVCLVVSGSPIFAAAEPDTALPRFDIFEYAVEGNTRLADRDIELAVSPFLGEDKSFDDVQAARSSLEKAYHDAGYLTAVVSIPDQKVDEGVVTLSVLEGKVDRLRVKGADYHQSSAIKQGLPELAQGNVPYFPNVQSQLDTLNRSADMKVTPVLKAGRKPGTVDIVVEVDDQLPLHGNLELNNRQSPGTDALRLAGSIRYDNLWQLGHSLGVMGQVAPEAPDQMKMLAANYAFPVNRQGDTLALYAVHSSSNVPGTTSVLNNSDIVGVRYVLPLAPSGNYGHSLSAGFDLKHIDRVQAQIGSGASTTLQPAITYVPLVASYNGGWSGDGSNTGLDSTLTIGMRGLFGNSEGEFSAKRPGASAQYLSLRTGGRHTENFRRWSLSGRLDVQLASGMLLPNEQYAAGGVDTVRGYQESEQTGDRAVRFGLEVRTPGFQLGSGAWPLRLTGVGFYDSARLTSLQYDPSRASALPSRHYLLRGAGVGLRLSGPKGLSMDLDVARALDDGGTASNNTKSGDVRVHSRLVWEF